MKRPGGDEDTLLGSGSLDDPLRDVNVEFLARQLPVAKAGGSLLVCRITGALMTGDNAPLACPNGNVYGARGVALVQRETHDGAFIDPCTAQRFTDDEMLRVYIM